MFSFTNAGSRLVLLLLMCAVLALHAHSFAADSDYIEHKIRVGEVERTFYVHLPKRKEVREATGLPVVLALHGGGGGDPRRLGDGHGFNALADRENFIVVYPVGLDKQWNDGRNAGFFGADNSHVDDVGFIDKVVTHMLVKYRGDRRRVYATGVSNGGMMTYRLGVELSSRFAAIAPVIANIPKNLLQKKENLQVKDRLSVLIMNGTEDPLVPFEGGFVHVGRKDYGEVVSAKESLAYFLKRNELPLKPAKKEDLPDIDPKDGSTVELSVFKELGNPAEIALYVVHGGGHAWPGSSVIQLLDIGNRNMDINATEVIWDFFKRQRRSE